MKIIKLKTGSKFEDHGSYSRVVVAGDWIMVSNTAGRNLVTKEIPEDIGAQTAQVFANVETALTAVGSSFSDVVRVRVFIQDPADIATVMTLVGEKFRGIDPACTATCPPLGSTQYKVEVEITALRGAGVAEVEYITIAP